VSSDPGQSIYKTYSIKLQISQRVRKCQTIEYLSENRSVSSVSTGMVAWLHNFSTLQILAKLLSGFHLRLIGILLNSAHVPVVEYLVRIQLFPKIKRGLNILKSIPVLRFMVRPAGFEPAAYGFEGMTSEFPNLLNLR